MNSRVSPDRSTDFPRTDRTHSYRRVLASELRTEKVDGSLVTGSQIRIPVSTRSAESHQACSGPSVRYDGSVAAMVNDGSASKPSASLGARRTVDEPSNPAVVANSSRQATDHIVALATAAVCSGIVTRQSQSQLLFEDSTDQNAVPVRIEKAGLRYIAYRIFNRMPAAGQISCAFLITCSLFDRQISPANGILEI